MVKLLGGQVKVISWFWRRETVSEVRNMRVKSYRNCCNDWASCGSHKPGPVAGAPGLWHKPGPVAGAPGLWHKPGPVAGAPGLCASFAPRSSGSLPAVAAEQDRGQHGPEASQAGGAEQVSPVIPQDGIGQGGVHHPWAVVF